MSDTTTTASDASERPDQVVGPYRILRPIGEGGMGVVYLARQQEPIRRDVALKIIKPGMDTQQVTARFESERQVLALMDHPNIARVFDAGTTSNGRPYFAMELVDGVAITTYCDAKRLSIRERLQLFLPVCRAIQHAHQKGAIHRDIKPSNLLVAETDGAPSPKVIDFGLAKALGQQLIEGATLTQFGTVVGTLEYMSPEQATTGRHDIDTRADVYSLGAVLYELLTGTTPLEQERELKAGFMEALERVRDEEPDPPSARLRRSRVSADAAAHRRSDVARLSRLLGGDLDWIVMKALEKDRNRRYETVNGLARDVERYLAGDPVEAGPPSAAYRIGKLISKYRWWVGTAAAFLVLLTAAVVVSALLAVRARRAEQIALATNQFLRNDLLAQASASRQGGPNTRPDPDIKVRTVLDRAAARIEGKFGAQPEIEASIRQTIGATYVDLGLYREALPQVERALDLRRRSRGETSLETLESLESLAGVHWQQGRYDLAEPVLRSLVDLRRRVSGPESSDTLISMNNLALVSSYQGKYTLAESIFVPTLEIRRRVSGSDHAETLGLMNNLAQVYDGQGKYSAAEKMYTEALEIRRRVSGPEHPETLTLQNNLGAVYRGAGKLAEAEAMYSQALDGRRRVLGETHPATLTAMNNLANIYVDLGRFSDALTMHSKVLELRRQVIGDEHPYTLMTRNNLARAYSAEGRYAEAGTLLAEALAAQRRVLGDEHPDTLLVMGNLGFLQRNAGNYADAESTLTKVAALRRRISGAEHPDTLLVEYRLALVFQNQRRYAEAEALFATVLDARRRVLGDRHRDTLATACSLGDAKLQQLKYAEAGKVLRDALGLFEGSDANTWPRYNCQSLLGSALAAQREFAEAERLLVEGYEGLVQRQAVMGAPNRYWLDRAGDAVVALYKSAGDLAKAAEWQAKTARPR